MSMTAVLMGAAVAVFAWAAAAQAAPSSQDSSFLKSNEQVNLAEQTIGQIAEQRSQDPDSLALARMTISDHHGAQQKLTALAGKLGTRLPDAPDAAQRTQAAQLKSVAASSFDLAYVQIQIAGHEQSIADTKQEISAGTDPSVIAYAKWYLPVAQKHLQMAQNELRSLSGAPTAVPAGSGGMAASGSTGSAGWEIGFGVGALAAAVGVIELRRSRRAPEPVRDA
jgi:predicted outer membrane protein